MPPKPLSTFVTPTRVCMQLGFRVFLHDFSLIVVFFLMLHRIVFPLIILVNIRGTTLQASACSDCDQVLYAKSTRVNRATVVLNIGPSVEYIIF